MLAWLGLMSRSASKAVLFISILIAASLSPLIGTASAHEEVILSVDKAHIVLEGGYSDNLTLTIENDGQSIESYNISINTTSLSSVWNVTSVNNTVEDVLPTFTATTEFIIRLGVNSEPSDSGSFVISVSQQDDNFTSNITVYLTVAPSYATSVSFNQINGPLQRMSAGTTTNFTIDVNNDGNSIDTILLDVDSEPDLAAFWNNHTNSSNNNSGNNTGNNSGNNSSSNPANVLMYGNSYIYTNNVDTILQDILTSTGTHNSTVSKVGGGMTLKNHWDKINTTSDTWNTTLTDVVHDWDYVVLQDQSQIPGFYRTEPSWIDSKDSAVEIAQVVENESSEVVLMMTWGRRSGDPSNALIYSNYTNMQDRLEEGYIDFRDNMSTPSRDVWIAPVGLAFKEIYYNVIAEGATPELVGNTFYDLYTSDGSHPSLSGSYLAACVLYATMTGESPVNSTDSVSLSSALKLELQQAAANTVFNTTSHLDYPWQNNGPAMMSVNQNRAIPPGWNLVFADSELSNVAPYSTVQTTLQVSVPSDASPGFYGFNLFSATTMGNDTSNFTFVVEVTPDNSVSYSFVDQTSNFIPGQTTTTYLNVANTGNSELDMDWSLDVDMGPCNASLIDLYTNSFMPGDNEQIEFNLEVDSMADKSHYCDLTLTGISAAGEYQYQPMPFTFTINVDELIDFELSYGSGSSLDITPDVSQYYQIRVYNNGSEQVEFFLDIVDNGILDTAMTSSSGILVAANSVGLWNLSTSVNQGEVGIIPQSFSTTYQDITQSLSLDFDVQPVPSFTIDGPLDGRISTQPSQSVNVDLTLLNDGTMDLDLSTSVSGLPTGVEVSFSNTEIELSTDASEVVVMSLSLISTAQSGSYPIAVTFSSAEIARTIQLELQVANSVGFTVTSISNNVASGPISNAEFTFEVTNLGSAADTFFISLGYDNSNNASTWYDLTLETASVNLAPSSTESVTITISERSSGAPSSGSDVYVNVFSSNDNSLTDNIVFKVIPISAGAEITVLAGDDSAKPGESISGDIVVTNTGTGIDQFLLTTVGGNCDLSEIFTLESGLSSQPFSWTCPVDENAAAGTQSLKFRVTSSARSNYFLEEVEFYTVEPTWVGNDIISIEFGDGELAMSSSGGSSTTVTITNLANTQITGDIFVLGADESIFDTSLTALGTDDTTGMFTIANGQSQSFELLLNSRIAESEDAAISLIVNVQVGDSTYKQTSTELPVSVEGPELPPNGIELPLNYQLSQNDAMVVMSSGWVFSILLLVLLNMLRKRRKLKSVEATEEEESDDNEEEKPKAKKPKKEKEVVAHKLRSNECRMTPDNKVNCPFCESKLGVPRGSVPPFKFTCPKCSKKIRVVENQKF